MEPARATGMMIDQELQTIRHFALDMDGTLYSGKTLFPDTRPFLQLLSDLGIGHTFFTNNSSKSVRDYVAHLQRMGIGTEPSRMQTSTLSTFAWLREHRPRLRRFFLLGSASMIGEFKEAGYEFDDDDPEMVVVGFDPELDFSQLCRAGYWIKQGRPFIATHPDRICPTDQPTLLIDCGAVCAALTSATGQKPQAVLGKPHPIMIEDILHRHGLSPAELAVVGDRVYTDIAMAKRVGSMGILVLSGETTRQEGEAASPRPDLIVSGVGELGGLLRAAAASASRTATR